MDVLGQVSDLSLTSILETQIAWIVPLQVGEGGEWSEAPWDCSVPQFRGHLLLKGCVTLAATCVS